MEAGANMSTHLSLSLILLVAAVGSARGGPEVKDSSSNYSCCEAKITFNQRCENAFNLNEKPFAHSKDKDCIHPCKKIEDGVMMMAECVDVNATMVCIDMNVATEERIIHRGRRCSGSLLAPGNHGPVHLPLLAVVIGGLFVKEVIC